MPGGWRDEYLSSLEASLRVNDTAGSLDLIRACSQLQDKITALEAEKAALEATIGTDNTPKGTPKKTSGKDPSQDEAAAPEVVQLKLELAEALRSQGQFESRLRTAEEALQTLRAKSASDSASIRTLSSEKNLLVRRLKDRELELREKAKFVEGVQDETITLTLQLNLAEKERDKVKAENAALVARWKERVEKEVEAMNLANEPIFDKRRR